MAGAIGSIFGGTSTPSAIPAQTYTPQNTAWADTNYQGQTNQNIGNNPYTGMQPWLSTLQTGIQNNPYAPAAQAGANTAGTTFNNTGTGQVANMNTLNGQVAPQVAAGQQVLNTAMDPQQALYARTLQQVTDQQNVANAQAGVSGSGYGASLMDNNLTNFNIDWQNQLLQRQLSGLSGYTGAVSNAGGTATTAGNLGSTGAANFNSGGITPYNQYIANTVGPATNANTIAGVQTGQNTVNQQNIQDLLSYLGYATGQFGANNSGNAGYYAQQANSASQNQSGIGSLIGTGADIASMVFGF